MVRRGSELLVGVFVPAVIRLETDQVRVARNLVGEIQLCTLPALVLTHQKSSAVNAVLRDNGNFATPTSY